LDGENAPGKQKAGKKGAGPKNILTTPGPASNIELAADNPTMRGVAWHGMHGVAWRGVAAVVWPRATAVGNHASGLIPTQPPP
jgi:hypothetical protein